MTRRRAWRKSTSYANWPCQRFISRIGVEPLSVEADKVVTITDPATAMDIVAADTVVALRARRGRR